MVCAVSRSENLILPVCAGVTQSLGLIASGTEFCSYKIAESLGIHHTYFVVLGTNGERTVVIHFNPAGLTSLGRDDDYTV